jgi:hypothetical protein
MTDVQRRLQRLEAHDTRLAWADVHTALMRHQARARLAICRRLGIDDGDTRLVDAMDGLQGDTPDLARQDGETVAHWQRRHGVTIDRQGARRRITARLDAMARRQQRTA